MAIEYSTDYTAKHYLSYHSEDHNYILNGEWVPGPSTFIDGSLPLSQMVQNWQIKQGSTVAAREAWGRGLKLEKPTEAKFTDIAKRSVAAPEALKVEGGVLGSILHEYALKRETSGLPEALRWLDSKERDEKAIRCIKGFEAWKDETNGDVVALEALTAHPELGYAGRFDRLERRNGVTILVDYKTSKSINFGQYLQALAYAGAVMSWQGYTVDAVEIARFGKDGRWSRRQFEVGSVISEPMLQIERCLSTWKFLKNIAKDFGWHKEVKRAA